MTLPSLKTVSLQGLLPPSLIPPPFRTMRQDECSHSLGPLPHHRSSLLQYPHSLHAQAIRISQRCHTPNCCHLFFLIPLLKRWLWQPLLTLRLLSRVLWLPHQKSFYLFCISSLTHHHAHFLHRTCIVRCFINLFFHSFSACFSC